jgi:uncharacterized protein YegP (UPF0339 family)
MKEHFVMFVGRDGKIYFNLKAPNYKIVLRCSEGYNSKSDAHAGIDSVQKHCSEGENYVRKVAKNDEPFFVLRAKNNEIIGVSETYSSARERDKGIDRVKNYGSTKVILGINETFYEAIINGKSFDIKKGNILGSDILKIADFIGSRFCLFLIKDDGSRVEIQQNQTFEVKGCVAFKVIRND